METKKYSSYAQIERELEILKIEKEISYQKLVLGVKKTKENLSPQNIVSDLVASYSAAIPYGSIVSASIPFILNKTIPIVKNWYSKRKRGL